MTRLLIRTQPSGAQTRLVIIGALDRQTAQGLYREVSCLLTEGATRCLVVDLRCCTYVDDEGLRTLCQAQRTAAAAGKALRLQAVPPLIDDLLRRSRHDEDLPPEE